MKEFDAETLKKRDGKDGNPVYIAYKGRVIDVSRSNLWKTGVHMNRHKAGLDLTADIQAAPHDTAVLDRYLQVGMLQKQEAVERQMPGLLSTLMTRFPMLRRHPHPMMVHFPIVFSVSTFLFTFLYFITGISSFETTALHCLGGAVLFTPVGMATGWFTWWLNYFSKKSRPVTIKIRCSLLLMGIVTGAFLWRCTVPDILTSFSRMSILYLLLILLLIPIITVIGWFGASLTFPTENE
jgi:predicted heme/steroid binding protein/uncharacterized membrane protein